MHKGPAAVGPKDTEKPSREQDERSREEHATFRTQHDPNEEVVRLPNRGRCEMSSEMRGQWGGNADQRRRAGMCSSDSAESASAPQKH